jgi:hypothetical protein
MNNITGIVVELEILQGGLGLLDTIDVPTYISSKNDLDNTFQIISTNPFTQSLGTSKIDNLRVDLTLDTSGTIISAIPNYLHRGFHYSVGDIVSVGPIGPIGPLQGPLQIPGILKITQVV